MPTPNISQKRLKQIAANFSQSSIMVVGDSMLDEYVWGDVSRISPEAPVPVVHVRSRSSRLGGAANVVQNLKSLGVSPYLVSLCGNDDTGILLRKKLEQAGCNSKGLAVSCQRSTTIKTRIIARHQQVVRVDSETVIDVTKDEAEVLWKSVSSELSRVKGVIISDYSKGVVSKPFIVQLLDACKKRNLFVAIDPKERHFDLYKGVSIITPNLKEAHAVLGVPNAQVNDREIELLGWKIVKKLDLPYLLITLSERGMALFERNTRTFSHLPTVARNVFDVTGAGDTVISVYAAAIISGAKPIEAAYLSNHAAGIIVGELGTACVTPEALLAACAEKYTGQ
ncbi:MAG TPA: D-glycero-beta-D-manno-heptose-7-phosphate kinase [Chitinivibrionales bacterium]|nr:D-glycero-beta-D-manno-heptose-7-phosphate kinase [Chitinivibrionales bacterium]